MSPVIELKLLPRLRAPGRKNHALPKKPWAVVSVKPVSRNSHLLAKRQIAAGRNRVSRRVFPGMAGICRLTLRGGLRMYRRTAPGPAGSLPFTPRRLISGIPAQLHGAANGFGSA